MLTLEKLKEILSSKQNNKPIRLIELFAGYGSQSLALKYLGIPFEHHCICEWAVKSIQAYKDIHFPNDNTDYSNTLTFDEVVEDLFDKGISADYSKPMTKDQIKRMGEKKCRTCYNNIIATKNLVSITNTVGGKLHIENTEKYQYIMTYSFPCQDLSNAGQRKGMEKGSGTRSGLLWEVERLLRESPNKPQILLMENVPQVHGKKNLEHFNEWIKVLESFGYKNYWKDLNAKNYGIPQNRNRCFMVSVLSEKEYVFPTETLLKHKVNDLLENTVDEKYYLSDKALLETIVRKFKANSFDGRTEKNGVIPSLCARDYKDPKLIVEPTIIQREHGFNKGGEFNISPSITTSSWQENNFVKEPIQKRIGGLFDEEKTTHQAGSIYDKNGLSPCLDTAQGGYRTPLILDETLKSKMCNDLILSGKVQENDVIRHSYSSSRMNGEMKDIQQNNICPTLDTRCDCLGVVINEDECYDTYNNVIKKDICGSLTAHGNIGNRNIGTYLVNKNLRIRKLTPKECFRLMGVKDDDFERVAVNQSNASLYHLAGDSIVVNVLMAIFEQFRKIIN